jgi:hypothetical protein
MGSAVTVRRRAVNIIALRCLLLPMKNGILLPFGVARGFCALSRHTPQTVSPLPFSLSFSIAQTAFALASFLRRFDFASLRRASPCMTFLYLNYQFTSLFLCKDRKCFSKIL